MDISSAQYYTPDFSLDVGKLLPDFVGGRELEGSCAGNDLAVVVDVLDSAETVTDGVLGLGDRVVIGALDQDSAREWILDTLDECVLVIAERLLVDKLGETEIALLNIVDGVELLATAGERDTLTVPALGTADADDTVAGKDLKRGRVNTLLVDNDKVFVSTVTETLLELNDLHHAVVSELTLRLYELLPLLSVTPEESGVDLSFLVL